MAESPKGKKTKKTIDAFADDLDAMLNTDSSAKSAKQELIEDDAAIDRLLMHDSFQTADEGGEDYDIDKLIAEEAAGKRKSADIDELLADFQITPSRAKDPIFDEFDDIIGDDEEKHRVRNLDEVISPELSALERVEDIDEFADDPVDSPAEFLAAADLRSGGDEAMEEIDEFTAEIPSPDREKEFPQIDFDISSGELDDLPPPTAKTSIVGDPDAASDIEALIASAVEEDADIPSVSGSKPNTGLGSDERREEIMGADIEVETPPIPERFSMPPEFGQLLTEAKAHGVQMAELDRQITVLKKQLQVIRQEMTEKAAKSDLVAGLESIESLQTEQKKSKRALEALDKKKPVAAYVAAGLAVATLFIGTGLGFQGFIAKSQVAELTQMLIKTQEQIKSAPASQAADVELTRKKLDELAVADSVAASQIAEIKKSLPTTAGAGSGGDVAKQLADLTAQNMQMGAAIEAMENNIKALQKNRPTTPATAVAPKPEKKTPPVIVENWAVNLIAFKQDWYAKRKAEEFAAKGVPAKVSKSESKGETWYRLSVDGFKSQYEAAGYAAKVKKNLNLDSVWVARIKE